MKTKISLDFHICINVPLKVNYSFMLRRFAKFFNLKLEFKMVLFKNFLNLCYWFLKNKLVVNFLGLKTKLVLIVLTLKLILKFFIQLFFKFLCNNILFYPSYLGPTGLIYLQPMVHLQRNQVTDLFALAKCEKPAVEK